MGMLGILSGSYNGCGSSHVEADLKSAPARILLLQHVSESMLQCDRPELATQGIDDDGLCQPACPPRPLNTFCMRCEETFSGGSATAQCPYGCGGLYHHNCIRPHIECIHPDESVPDGFKTMVSSQEGAPHSQSQDSRSRSGLSSPRPSTNRISASTSTNRHCACCGATMEQNAASDTNAFYRILCHVLRRTTLRILRMVPGAN